MVQHADIDHTGITGVGGAMTVENEGTPLATSATTLDFVGAGVTASGTGAEKTITVPGYSITTSSNKITGDVTMTNANQFYDGASLTLGAGTYFLSGGITMKTTAAIGMTAKLWNGTTVESSSAITIHANTYEGQIFLSGVVVLAGSETWKISAAGNGTTGTIKAAATNNSAGNNATFLYALKIA